MAVPHSPCARSILFLPECAIAIPITPESPKEATAQRGSASMSSGRHSSERKAVSSKALVSVTVTVMVRVGVRK